MQGNSEEYSTREARKGGVRMLHLYYGDGKGKTSAAMGMVLRAAGHEIRALVAQFLKDGSSGELGPVRALGAIVVSDASITGFYSLADERARAIMRASQRKYMQLIRAALASERPGLIVLDELAVAVALGAADEAEALQLIGECMEYGEVVVTGNLAPRSFIEKADYVTHLVKERHPFDQGQAAREGIEW